MRVSLRWVAIDVVEVGGFGLHADVSLLWVFKATTIALIHVGGWSLSSDVSL